MRQPNFDNILKVLNNQVPNRPTLFEMYMNPPLYEKLAGKDIVSIKDELTEMRILIHAFKNAGYDYATVHASDLHFPKKRHSLETISLNEGMMIKDWESYNAYPWPDPDKCDYSMLDRIKNELPEGMKLIVMGHGGVLENVISLVGYDNLCFMLMDEPKLLGKIFERVGTIFVRYYEIASQYDAVGALISNDDWGFNTQTMISPQDLRAYVIPWHKKIVEAIHKAGKPAILHSCGNLENVMDDIIDDIQYDAKHSYEDNIITVEEAYERWGDRIAILGAWI